MGVSVRVPCQQLVGQPNHLGSNVDTVDFLGDQREELQDAADAAPDLEELGWLWQFRVDVLEDCPRVVETSDVEQLPLEADRDVVLGIPVGLPVPVPPHPGQGLRGHGARRI